MRKKLTNILLIAFCSLFFQTQTKAQDYNYAEALQKSMFFYECQESGALNNTNRVSWRANSALDDGADVGHDLTGGWYDAGDHVKFNFPMAFTATMLAWGGIDFAEGYNSTGQMQYLKRNLRWVNDYFIKCHTAPNEYWGQVGNGAIDHSWWGSAEVMQMERPAYKIDASNPGSDLAAETAAAMAAASIIFKDDDPQYSTELLSHAEQLYNFADNYRGVYSDAITDAASYYKSYSGYNDELVWGAIWLYRATEDQAYLDKAEAYYDNLGNEGQTSDKAFKWALAWDDKSYGCYALLAKLTGKTEYQQDIERHLDYWTDGYNGQKISYTPGGLAYLDVWGSLRYAVNTSFLAEYYADAASTPQKQSKYEAFAISQINYALGDNPRNSSYVCGFGNNPPVNPHHRTAHGCWSNNHNGPPENTRHTLYGAMVGGPNNDDSYEDDRSNYVNNEVACDYNTGFSGLLAALSAKYGNDPLSNFPIAETPQDEFLVESKINASGGTYTEWSVWVYNHTAWPARIPSEYKFQLFIDISEGLAAGYSASDYVVSTNNSGVVTMTSLMPWDAENNIYYTEVTFNPDIMIWPGGTGESKEEAQMRIRLPYDAPASAWDASNDWSYQDVDGTLKEVPNIPLYVDGDLVYGNTPTEGPEVVPVASVNVSPSTVSLNTGETAQLTASISPQNATNKNVTWTTDNSAVATVSTGGLVNAVSEGTSVITATTQDGGYTSTCSVNVTQDTTTTTYTLDMNISGTGTVNLDPSGGTYAAGTTVTLTANPSSGFQFDGWDGDLTGNSNPVEILMNANKNITATFSETSNGTACDSPTAISLSFAFDGAGEYCWVTSGTISYINSWNMQLLEINGVDYTNTWSNSMPAKIDGNYYIHYVGPFDWSHFEAVSQNNRIEGTETAKARNSAAHYQEIKIYPNPSKAGKFNVDMGESKETQIARITIFDLQGRQVFSNKMPTKNKIAIDANLSPGIYNIKIDTPSGTIINKKLIIK